MLLIGRNHSPYTRRVAITCALQGRTIERRELGAREPENAAEICRYNPGLRVPILVLDDGTPLIETAAICEWLDETAPEGKRLIPASGVARRDALQLIALAHQTTEKLVTNVYEGLRRPAEYHWPEFQERTRGQIAGGLEALEALVPDGFFGGEQPDGRDVAVICCWHMAELTAKDLIDGRYPRLTAFADRMMAIPAVADTYPR
ncbi:glutathione S-transferase family protein [Acuticoccus sp. M5D2P5]|uniref:glutathione S-transferase family protein n=1 Tax=Acuticoccus kalidii TaxID=2910977 RepID=UPI001F1835E2|nr:glutathione S-transferase family protein [Acuticoccus kalidii]MCF3933146.1 glutathione S-transferase family protein [Acuticoccus kalidii]